MVLLDSGLVVFVGAGALLAVRADSAFAVFVTVTVALGSAVVVVPSPEIPRMTPRMSAATAVMIRAGHPNRLGFFECRLPSLSILRGCGSLRCDQLA
jgi:hypothetical protein